MRPRPIRKPTTPETREPRVPLQGRVVEVAIRLAGGGHMDIHGRVHTLNTLGMKLWSRESLPAESECLFRVISPHGAEATGRGWVVSSNEHGMAIQFDILRPEMEAIITRIISRQSLVYQDG